MLQRISHFLQVIRHKLHSDRAALAKRQMASARDTSIRQTVSTIQKSFGETDALPVMSLSAQRRTTDSFRTLVRLKPPAQRYRELDAMLEQIKKDRLNAMETQLVQQSAHELARQLQHDLDDQSP